MRQLKRNAMDIAKLCGLALLFGVFVGGAGLVVAMGVASIEAFVEAYAPSAESREFQAQFYSWQWDGKVNPDGSCECCIDDLGWQFLPCPPPPVKPHGNPCRCCTVNGPDGQEWIDCDKLNGTDPNDAVPDDIGEAEPDGMPPAKGKPDGPNAHRVGRLHI